MGLHVLLPQNEAEPERLHGWFLPIHPAVPTLLHPLPNADYLQHGWCFIIPPDVDSELTNIGEMLLDAVPWLPLTRLGKLVETLVTSSLQTQGPDTVERISMQLDDVGSGAFYLAVGFDAFLSLSQSDLSV